MTYPRFAAGVALLAMLAAAAGDAPRSPPEPIPASKPGPATPDDPVEPRPAAAPAAIETAFRLPPPSVVNPHEGFVTVPVVIADEFLTDDGRIKTADGKPVLSIVRIVWSVGGCTATPPKWTATAEGIVVRAPADKETIAIAAAALVVDSAGHAYLSGMAHTRITGDAAARPLSPDDGADGSKPDTGTPPGQPAPPQGTAVTPIPLGSSIQVILVLDLDNTTGKGIPDEALDLSLSEDVARALKAANPANAMHRYSAHATYLQRAGMAPLVAAVGGPPCVIVEQVATDPRTGKPIGKALPDGKAHPLSIAVTKKGRSDPDYAAAMKLNTDRLLDLIGRAASGMPVTDPPRTPARRVP